METLHQVGDVISDRYKILGTLGQGGIGITYKALDQKINKFVAIKTLSLRQVKDWKVLELFEREAKVLSQLNHPGIPKYLDYFQMDAPQDRHFYIIQEVAVGRSLEDLVAGFWHATEAEVKDLAKQILKIISYLHSLTPPVIHRDIKPQNIIRQENGKVFLVDFGAVQHTYRQTMIGGSTAIGTYGFMAPEQFRGQAEPATDLYGLGATLLFLLTHRSPADLPQRRLKIDFRSSVQVSPEFADWLEKMLEPLVEDRFASAKEALAVLQGDREIIYPPSNLQPAGSRMMLKKTGRQLILDIPPSGLQSDTLFLAVFAVLWLGFIFFWTFSAIAARASLFFVFFSIPFWAVGWGMLGNILFAIAGSTRLEIDPQTFRLQWNCLGFNRQIEGKTAEIDRVELLGSNFKINYPKPTTITCGLVEGVNTHRFGSRMTQVEKEWLVKEVAAFLRKLPSFNY